MASDKQLDHLIGVLYETALNSTLWPEAILLTARQTGCVAAHIMTINNRNGKPELLVAAGDGNLPTPENQNLYLNHYVKIDPRMQVMINAKLYEWRYCYTFMDQTFVNKNEFYQEFLIPGGARYALGAWIDESENERTVLGLHRDVGQPLFNEKDSKNAERFSGHLQRALRLQRHTKILQQKADLGARAIDAFGLAMLIVNNKAGILHINVAAEGLLKKGQSSLTTQSGRLSADNPATNHKLATLIAEATGQPGIGGAMFLPDTKSHRVRQLLITPLPASSPFVKDWQSPLALILIPELGKALSSMQFISKLYNFSPAETKVADALMMGKSPEEYSQETGVTLNTVRTQIKNLLRKTDCGRQSELIALLSRVPPLLE